MTKTSCSDLKKTVGDPTCGEMPGCKWIKGKRGVRRGRCVPTTRKPKYDPVADPCPDTNEFTVKNILGVQFRNIVEVFGESYGIPKVLAVTYTTKHGVVTKNFRMKKTLGDNMGVVIIYVAPGKGREKDVKLIGKYMREKGRNKDRRVNEFQRLVEAGVEGVVPVYISDNLTLSVRNKCGWNYTYLMDAMDGSLLDLSRSGFFKKLYERDVEDGVQKVLYIIEETRKQCYELLKCGFAYIDLKPENILYALKDDKVVIRLGDLDGALASSRDTYCMTYPCHDTRGRVIDFKFHNNKSKDQCIAHLLGVVFLRLIAPVLEHPFVGLSDDWTQAAFSAHGILRNWNSQASHVSGSKEVLQQVLNMILEKFSCVSTAETKNIANLFATKNRTSISKPLWREK